MQFDLSSLPKGTRIYRASLQCERQPIDGGDPRALEDVEIHPLGAPYQKGSPPQTEGKPLAPVPPWYLSFDVTELVRGWVAGKPASGLYVKKFPGWLIGKTCLDLMYEGEPAEVSPQASDVKAFHRAGQTFITWKEIDDLVGKDEATWSEVKAILDGLDAKAQVRYCVYRSEKPITAASLPQAELLATVKPLSGWNVNGRNIERPIDIVIATKDYFPCGHWNPFNNAGLDGEFGRDCPIDRLVIRDDDKPVDRSTGLYVHTPTAKGKACYAVVTVVDGVANARDLSARNVPSQYYRLLRRICGWDCDVRNTDESTGSSSLFRVVRKGFAVDRYHLHLSDRNHGTDGLEIDPWHGLCPAANGATQWRQSRQTSRTEKRNPYFDSSPRKTAPVTQPQLLAVSQVTWLLRTNQPTNFAEEPYYNGSVAIPESVLAAGEKAALVPLELTLHRDGNSYWRTQFRIERDSIVLAPYDFPIRSWWYGYHECSGALRSYSQGVIRPYTERRLPSSGRPSGP